MQSCRPISNLSVLSKLLERLVAHQLLAHLNSTGLLPRFESAYWAYLPTETAVHKVLLEILLAVNAGDLSTHILFYLSAALDTVDQGILLQRLNSSYQIVKSVQHWMRSNHLQLNEAKTEILWSATSHRLHQLLQARLLVGTDFVTPSAVVRNLGIYGAISVFNTFSDRWNFTDMIYALPFLLVLCDFCE